MWELGSRKAHTVAIFLYQQRGLCLHPASLDGARPPCVHILSHLRNTQRWLLHQHGWQPPPPKKHSLPFCFLFRRHRQARKRTDVCKNSPMHSPISASAPVKTQGATGQSSDGRTRQLGRVRGHWNVYTSNHEWGTVSAYEPLSLPSGSSELIEPDRRQCSLLHLSETELFSLLSFVSFPYHLYPSCLHHLPPQYRRWPQDHKQLKNVGFRS